MKRTKAVESELDKLYFSLRGHRAKASREEIPPTHPPLMSRLRSIIWAQYSSTSAPTQTQIDSYNIIKEELTPILKTLKKLAQEDIKNIEKEMDKAGIPWTSGRIPEWEN
jgi:hypothetical protein